MTKEERLLVYRETTNEMGEVQVVCYDQATSKIERRFGYDENGRLHGYYQKWDREGNPELNTKYQHGIEMGPRVAKLRGLYPDIWEHSSMGENGLWGEVVYSRSPDTTNYANSYLRRRYKSFWRLTPLIYESEQKRGANLTQGSLYWSLSGTP